jgi:hypothetical protein
MERYAVVLFRLIESTRGAAVRETGGGVVFVPEPRPENLPGLVAALAARHFRHPLGPVVEIGYATLDRAQLERHCQRDGGLFWQGGDG